MTRRNGIASWMTARRLSTHGSILAICFWSAYIWNITAPGLLDRSGTVKGADFIHLYTLGSVALEHRADYLYDVNAQAKLLAQRVPAAAGMTYIPLYPPQVSVFFAPLAALPYATGLGIWLAISASLYALCCHAVWRNCPDLAREGTTVLLLALGFPAFFHLILWGQSSAIALACFTVAFLFLRSGRPFLAGVALGCLIFKPQLGIASAVIFVSAGAWRVAGGAFISALAQLAVALIYYGVQSLRTWAGLMLSVTYTIPQLEPRPYQTHSLRTFWTMLIPGHVVPFGLYVVSAVAILGMAVAVWRRPDVPPSLRYSVLLIASALVAPHLIVYDLVILAPAFLLLSDWLICQGISAWSGKIASVLYLIYLSPLLGPFARWTHVQISVVLMSWLVYLLCRGSRLHAPAPPDSVPAQ